MSNIASLIVGGRIEPAIVQKFMTQSKLAKNQFLRSLIDEAKTFSRPSVSGYRVGAVGLGQSGAVYLGANLEFSDSQLIQTVHAEQAVVINAMANGENGLAALAISAAPCGPCRQFLQELADAAKLEIWLERDEPYTLAEFLPASFGPHDLGVEGGLLKSASIVFANRQLAERKSDAADAAFDAASKSYAPYTHANCGCALTAAEGQIFCGSYIENAAFNPSISAFHAAAINLILAGHELAEITAVNLAFVDNRKINHLQCTQQLLSSLGMQHMNVQTEILSLT